MDMEVYIFYLETYRAVDRHNVDTSRRSLPICMRFKRKSVDISKVYYMHVKAHTVHVQKLGQMVSRQRNSHPSRKGEKIYRSPVF